MDPAALRIIGANVLPQDNTKQSPLWKFQILHCSKLFIRVQSSGQLQPYNCSQIQLVSIKAWEDYHKTMPGQVWILTFWVLHTIFLEYPSQIPSHWKTFAAIKILYSPCFCFSPRINESINILEVTQIIYKSGMMGLPDNLLSIVPLCKLLSRQLIPISKRAF